MYRNACSLQQQNAASNTFGNLSGNRNRTRWGAVGGRKLSAGLGELRSNPSAIAAGSRPQVLAQNEPFCEMAGDARRELMQGIAEINQIFPLLRTGQRRSAFSFVALLWRVRHLSAH